MLHHLAAALLFRRLSLPLPCSTPEKRFLTSKKWMKLQFVNASNQTDEVFHPNLPTFCAKHRNLEGDYHVDSNNAMIMSTSLKGASTSDSAGGARTELESIAWKFKTAFTSSMEVEEHVKSWPQNFNTLDKPSDAAGLAVAHLHTKGQCLSSIVLERELRCNCTDGKVWLCDLRRDEADGFNVVTLPMIAMSNVLDTFSFSINLHSTGKNTAILSVHAESLQKRGYWKKSIDSTKYDEDVPIYY